MWKRLAPGVEEHDWILMVMSGRGNLIGIKGGWREAGRTKPGSDNVTQMMLPFFDGVWMRRR